MHTAGRTSSKLGFNTRQSAGFDAVAHVLPGGTRSEHVDFIEFHHPKLEVYRVYRQEMGKFAQREDATPIGCKRFIAIFGCGVNFSPMPLERLRHGEPTGAKPPGHS